MKTLPSNSLPKTTATVVSLVAMLGSLLADTSRPEIQSRSMPEREFRLFVGIDIKAHWQEEFATVTDFVNERARLDSPDRPALPLSRLERVQFIHSTKLSRSAIAFGEIETDVAWGTQQEAGDWMRRQAALQSYSDDQVDILNNAVRRIVRETLRSANAARRNGCRFR